MILEAKQSIFGVPHRFVNCRNISCDSSYSLELGLCRDLQSASVFSLDGIQEAVSVVSCLDR